MNIDPELSRQIVEYFAERDDPVSISKAIKLVLSVCPDKDAEDLIFHVQYVDDDGRVFSDEETGLPTIIRKCNWLVV